MDREPDILHSYITTTVVLFICVFVVWVLSIRLLYDEEDEDEHTVEFEIVAGASQKDISQLLKINQQLEKMVNELTLSPTEGTGEKQYQGIPTLPGSDPFGFKEVCNQEGSPFDTFVSLAQENRLLKNKLQKLKSERTERKEQNESREIRTLKNQLKTQKVKMDQKNNSEIRALKNQIRTLKVNIQSEQNESREIRALKNQLRSQKVNMERKEENNKSEIQALKNQLRIQKVNMERLSEARMIDFQRIRDFQDEIKVLKKKKSVVMGDLTNRSIKVYN